VGDTARVALQAAALAIQPLVTQALAACGGSGTFSPYTLAAITGSDQATMAAVHPHAGHLSR